MKNVDLGKQSKKDLIKTIEEQGSFLLENQERISELELSNNSLKEQIRLLLDELKFSRKREKQNEAQVKKNKTMYLSEKEKVYNLVNVIKIISERI